MGANGLLIRCLTDRQYFFEQIPASRERDQRCPLRLYVQHFRAGLPVQPCPHGTERFGSICLTGAAVPARIWHFDATEYSADGVLPEALLVYRPRQPGQTRRRSRSSWT